MAELSSPQAIAEALARLDAALLDMDGTFYLGKRLLPGADAFLKKWTDSGRKALFVTNNSSRDALYYVEKLAGMGVCVPPQMVITSGQATALALQARYPGALAYVMGNDYVKRELRAAGVRVAQDERDAPDVLVAAYDTTLTYEKLVYVCDIVRSGIPFVATHPDFNCPVEGGFEPDLGSMLALIEASAGRRPDEVIGKPNRGIVDAALARVGAPADRTAMFGDRLYTDIATGVRHGMTAVLVLTGEAGLADVDASPDKPHLILPDLHALCAYL